MRPARLPIHQRHPNPSPEEREILASVAEGWTPQDTARHLATSRRTVTAALHRMRDRYNFPTNEALIAAAVKLEWIPLAIDCTDFGDTTSAAGSEDSQNDA
jgi:DNA-binding CsgD family transcriptional regulator